MFKVMFKYIRTKTMFSKPIDYDTVFEIVIRNTIFCLFMV